MGLSDRDYMRPDHARRAAASRRAKRPSLLQRLLFELWRVLRIRRGT